MKPWESVVSDYIDAWNRHDVQRIVDIFSEDRVYKDDSTEEVLLVLPRVDILRLHRGTLEQFYSYFEPHQLLEQMKPGIERNVNDTVADLPDTPSTNTKPRENTTKNHVLVDEVANDHDVSFFWTVRSKLYPHKHTH